MEGVQKDADSEDYMQDLRLEGEETRREILLLERGSETTRSVTFKDRVGLTLSYIK